MNISRRLSAVVAGFTLIELLISVLIFGFAGVAITTFLVHSLRGDRRLDQFHRLRRQAAHVRRFIEMEASLANRLERLNSNSIRLHGVHANGASWVIGYAVRAATGVNQSGSVFRGPFVLVRTGPAYGSSNQGVLSSSSSDQAQEAVILDELRDGQAFEIGQLADAGGISRGARLAIRLAASGLDYGFDFSVALPPSSQFSLLQVPTNTFTANCSGVPAGCRDEAANTSAWRQEWDTRLVSGTAITPVGAPKQVVVYFNQPRPVSQGAIRGSAGDLSSKCTRAGCFVGVGAGYSIGSPVNLLVFTDEVVAVPES